jgi:trans-2,3-dihydro-3-hydroxyanthranilate isomerase
MQRIAKEMNYSETTFVVSTDVRKGGYEVRIFTPEQELPLPVIPPWELHMCYNKKLSNNQPRQLS